jgi:hypothetical protein
MQSFYGSSDVYLQAYSGNPISYTCFYASGFEYFTKFERLSNR